MMFTTWTNGIVWWQCRSYGKVAKIRIITKTYKTKQIEDREKEMMIMHSSSIAFTFLQYIFILQFYEICVEFSLGYLLFFKTWF